MKKILIAGLIASSTLFFGCSKEKKVVPPPPAKLKIELVSGNNQTDTVGKILTIQLKVTLKGAPWASGAVRLIYQGCGDELVDERGTDVNGKLKYNWGLSELAGNQTLKVIVINSKNEKTDSLTVTATALSTGPGWHRAACSTFADIQPVAFCRLSTGRLFTCYGFGGLSRVRFSDDNGKSWPIVKSINASYHFFYHMFSTPSDEIFLFANTNGLLYSKDSGQTWTTLPTPPFIENNIYGHIYTSDGKILVATGIGIYISDDNGKSWVNRPKTAFTNTNPGDAVDDHFWSGAEDKDGNLYLLGWSAEIYKSTDKGQTWQAVLHAKTETTESFFIDINTNWFYKSPAIYQTGIYLSKDKGVTYSTIFDPGFSTLDQLSIQPDGKLYFSWYKSGLYRFNDLASPPQKLFNIGDNPSSHQQYILAKNNNIVVAQSSSRSIFYYQQ
jgi:photosystem II stability/assembly factor-like uncharacterized protein